MRCLPFVAGTAISEVHYADSTTHNPLLSPLTSNIPGPPVFALLGHVCAVHARLPTVLPGLALSAESHRNDLVAETDTDDPYVLRLR